MTGPHGPVGPDNPQSDDLGLSPDFSDSDYETESDSKPKFDFVDIPLNPGEYDKLVNRQVFLNKEIQELSKELNLNIEILTIDPHKIEFKIPINHIEYLNKTYGGIEEILSDLISFAIDKLSFGRNSADKQLLGNTFNLKIYKQAQGYYSDYQTEQRKVNPWARLQHRQQQAYNWISNPLGTAKQKLQNFLPNRIRSWDRRNPNTYKNRPGQDQCKYCGRWLATLSPDQILVDDQNYTGAGVNKVYCSERCVEAMKQKQLRNPVPTPTGTPSVKPPKIPAPSVAPVTANVKIDQDTTLTQVQFDPLNLCVEFLHDFSDKDELHNFIESLDENDLNLIIKNKDNPDALRKIRMVVRQDLEDTAKQLQMEN